MISHMITTKNKAFIGCDYYIEKRLCIFYTLEHFKWNFLSCFKKIKAVQGWVFSYP